MTSWERINGLMNEKRISLKQLAQIAGVVPSSVTKWKNGSSIRNDSLKKIALHFGKSTDWLLTGRDDVSHLKEQVSTISGDGKTLRSETTETGNPAIPLPSDFGQSAENHESYLVHKKCPYCAEKDNEIRWLRETISRLQNNFSVALDALKKHHDRE